MNYMEILNKWGEYINYNREQKTFNLMNNDYRFHKIGETIERILQEYDGTGMLAVIYARLHFERVMSEGKISVLDILENPDCIRKEREMYECLNSTVATDAEKKFISKLNSLYSQVTQGKLIGEGEDNRKEIMNSLDNVMTDIAKCNTDLFLKGEEVGKIENISTKLHIFNNLAECLLTIEKSADGMYYCFISAENSADCYFSFFIKNNGNIISVNDRANEQFIGQHSVSRNGRWTEQKADGIFPYDYIFNYSGHDYKGYATKYEIDENAVDMYNLGIEVFMPIIIAMLLLVFKFSNKELDLPMKHIDSFLPANIEKIENHALMPIGKSELAVKQAEINISYSNEEIISGTPAEEFTNKDNHWDERGVFENKNQYMIDLWGEGFVYDPSNLFQKSNVTYLIDKEKEENKDKELSYIPEFIGTEKKMRMQVYTDARKQLADYMRQKIYEEWDRFGRTKAVEEWYTKALVENKDYLLRLMYETYAGIRNKEGVGSSIHICPGSYSRTIYHTEQCVIGIQYDEEPGGWEISRKHGLLGCIKTPSLRGYYYDSLLDETNGKKCNMWFVFTPQTWENLEELTGREVPKCVKGWLRNGHSSRGNHLLNNTDAVDDVGTPFEHYESRSKLYNNIREVEYSFMFAWGFSKSGWKKFVKEYEKTYKAGENDNKGE